MLPITDIHCHILPGADDGSVSMEETLALLMDAREQGITRMIVTPHFHPGRYIVDSVNTLEMLNQVREECRKHSIDIQLYPGQECYWYSDLLDNLQSGRALTMNGINFVLLEFDPFEIYSTIQIAVQGLISSGYKVIIAHFERYECLYGKEDRLVELQEAGAFLQLNFDSLLERDSLFRRNPWRKLVQEGIVDFLGSDTHGMHFRPLRVGQAVEWLEANVEPELVKKMLVTNPARLL